MTAVSTVMACAPCGMGVHSAPCHLPRAFLLGAPFRCPEPRSARVHPQRPLRRRAPINLGGAYAGTGTRPTSMRRTGSRRYGSFEPWRCVTNGRTVRTGGGRPRRGMLEAWALFSRRGGERNGRKDDKRVSLPREPHEDQAGVLSGYRVLDPPRGPRQS